MDGDNLNKRRSFEQEDDRMSDLRHALPADVHNKIGINRFLVNIVDTGEALDLTSTSLSVVTLAVGLFAKLERSSNVDEEKVSSTARLADHIPSCHSRRLVRRNRSSDDSSTSTGEFSSDKADALDVLSSVLRGESEFGREFRTNGLAKEERHGATALFVELDLESTSDLVFAAVVETGEEECETLLGFGWVGFAESLDDGFVGEPVGDRSASTETATEFGTGDVHGLGARGDLVDRLVLVGGGNVGHLLEGDHFDTEFLGVLGDEGLRIVRAVKVLSARILTRTGVVTADDKVGNAKVLADDGVPERFPGTTHSHGKGKKSKGGHTVGVSRHERLVDTNASVVVDITRLGHTNDGVDEHIGLALTSSSHGELTMSTVHRVTSLESDDLAPCDLGKVLPELSRGIPEGDVVIVGRLRDGLDLTTDIELLDALVEIGDGGVSKVIGAKDSLCLANLIDGVDVGDGDDGDGVVITRVAESDAGALLNGKSLDLGLVDIESDGHGEEVSVGQTHGLETPIVVGLVHEALEGGETTIDDEFEIAELALGEDEFGESVCLLGELSGDGSIANKQVLQDTTVRSVGHFGTERGGLRLWEGWWC